MARLLEGGARGATAEQFGMSRNVLRIWVSRYNEAGIAGLVERHGGGPPARLTAEQRHARKERGLAGVDRERDGIRLAVPANITLLLLPTYSPELNPRRHFLANRVIDAVKDLIEVCCKAWNAALRQPGFIKSVTGFSWLPALTIT